MGYSTVVAGTTITASWANTNVRDQVVTPFSTTSARSSAVSSPVEGMVSAITDDNRLEVYDGSAYQRFAHYASGGRTGGTWTRASNLSIASGGDGAQITYTAETSDSDGFLTPTSGTITIPSGLGGLYMFNIYFTWASAPSNPGLLVDVNSTRVYGIALGYSTTITSGTSGLLKVAAADTVSFKALQQSGSAININPVTLDFYRLAI